MSVNDTDEWASMIINELFDEANAFEKISKCASKDGKEAIDKNKSFEELHHDNGLRRYASENHNDNESDLKSNYDEKLEELGLKSNANSRIFYDFNKGNSGHTFSNDQDVFTNANNITSEVMKRNVVLMQVNNMTEIVTDSSDQTTEEKIKNDHTSEFKTENSKGEVFTTDLNTAFIQDNKNESAMADAPKETWVFLSENMKENSKDISGDSIEIPEILESLSFEELRYRDQHKTNKCFSTISDELRKDFSEKHYLDNDKIDFFLQFSDKNECRNEKIFSVGADLGVIGEHSQEYLNRIDEAIEHIGFRNLEKDKNGEIDRDIRRIGSHLYHQGFAEKYVKDTAETRWVSIDGFTGSEYLSASNFKTFSIGENLNENVNNVPNRDKEKINWYLKDEADENIIDSQKNGYMCSKERRKELSEENSENLNEKMIERKHKQLDDTNIENMTTKNRYTDVLGGHQIYINNSSRTVKGHPKKSIFTDCKSSIRKQEAEEIAEDVEEMDDGELQIRDRRAQLVVSTYKEISSLFEIIFVRRFAYVLVDSYEFLSCVFFLVVYLLGLLYERLQVLISTYRSLNVEKSLDSSSDEIESILSGSEESMMPSIALDTVLTDETMLYNGDEKVDSNVSDMRNEIKQLKNTNSWVEIEPSEVAVVSMEYEIVAKCIKNVYEKGETFLTCFQSSKQYRATVKTRDDCLIDIRFISNNENGKRELLLSEIDFDSEIVASSKGIHSGKNEITAQKVTDTSCDLVGIPDHYEYDADLKPIIKKSSISFLTEIFPGNPCADEKPLFNSTEVDVLEMESISKQRSCPDFEVWSAFNMDCYKIKMTPRNSMERFLNSSLDVNLSSLSSRSDILSETTPLLNESEDVPKDESKESVDDVKILNKIEGDECEELLSSNLEVSATENSELSFIDEAEEVLSEEKNENAIKRYSDNEISRNLNEKSHMERHCSMGFQVSDAADAHFEDNNDLGKSLMCGDTKFISSLPKPSNECDLPIKNETVPDEVKDNPKQKNNLRRRMSLILNNWRNIQVMPSCIVKNNKNKKKNDEPKGK